MPGDGQPDTLVLLPNNSNLQSLLRYLKGNFLALVLWAIRCGHRFSYRPVPHGADQMTILVARGVVMGPAGP